MLNKYYKRCPRCEEKNSSNALKCTFCGLIFERLKWATNKAGKKMLREGKKDKVIYVKDFPSDLARHKVLLMCIFLGLFGGHFYYVGKTIKGVFMTIGGVIALVSGIMNIAGVFPASIMYTTQIIVAIPVFVWLFSIFDIMVKRFKVPISIDLTEDR